MRTVPAGITQLIGNTPLLRIRMFEREFPRVEVYAKAEWFNPGGSVKDRAALSMIEDGERRGALTHDKTIIDSTSGNTGIAYALVGAAKGYRVKLVMPGNVSAERKALVTAYGAEIVYSDAGEGSDGAIRHGARAGRGATPTATSIPTSTPTPPTRARTTKARRSRSWSRRAGASRISSPASARPAPSSAPSRRLKEHDPSIRTIAVAAGGLVPRPRRPEAPADRDRAADLGPEPRRRDLGLPDRARLRPGARRGANRRPAGRPLERRGAVGGAAAGRDHRGGRGRHRLPRLGRPLPLDRALRRAR